MKEQKPKTGESMDSGLTTLLKKLSKDKPTSNMPQLPEPTFDRLFGPGFAKKKKR